MTTTCLADCGVSTSTQPGFALWQFRCVTSTTARLWRGLLAGLAVVCCPLIAAAEDCAANAFTEPMNQLNYSISCAGQSDCLATDTMTITPPTGATAPLVAMCLRLGNEFRPVVLDSGVKWDDKAAVAKLPLLPLLARQLDKEAASNEDPKKLFQALRESLTGKLRFAVPLQDKQDRRQVIPVEIDGGEFWRTRRLKLAIDSVNCGKPCALGSHLRVSAKGLEAWRAATKKDLSKLSVLIDDVRIPGIVPVLGSTDHELDFLLSRDLSKPESAKAWEALLQRATESQSLKFALADDDGRIAEDFPSTTKFEPAGSKSKFAVLLPIVIVALLAFVGLKTNLIIAIRDDAPTPVLSNDMPFSLGRTQMLLWTITVIAAWLFVGLSINDWSGPNATALILMGIGAGTSLGAAMAVDAPPALDNTAQTSLTNLAAAKAALVTQPKDRLALESQTAAITQLRQAGLWSKNLFADITSPIASDKSALHRLQIVGFTFVIWTYYLLKVWQTQAMPDLTDAQLALLGISSGSYVGYKFVNESPPKPGA